MKKSKIYLFGLLAVILLGAALVLSGSINNTSSDNDELSITKGEKSELAVLKCGDEGEKKCGEEGEKKCGEEGKKKECDEKKEEKKCGEEKCGGEEGGEEAEAAEEEAEE